MKRQRNVGKLSQKLLKTKWPKEGFNIQFYLFATTRKKKKKRKIPISIYWLKSLHTLFTDSQRAREAIVLVICRSFIFKKRRQKRNPSFSLLNKFWFVLFCNWFSFFFFCMCFFGPRKFLQIEYQFLFFFLTRKATSTIPTKEEWKNK